MQEKKWVFIDNMLDIFYKEIVYEASKGIIDNYKKSNIIFSTRIPEDNIFIEAVSNNKRVFIPTLNINNKNLFNKLLTEYVFLAKAFYIDDKNYIFLDSLEKEKYSKEKVILTNLWANATVEDYNNPYKFLSKRISFLKNTICFNESVCYSEVLDSTINIEIIDNTIFCETPQKIRITISNNDDLYVLPDVYYGLDDNKAYIYAIQNAKDINIENSKYQKKIKRLMFKVNDNFDTKKETDRVENIKDITSSFLLSANIATSFLNNLGVEELSIHSFLVSRWNEKELLFDQIFEYNKNKYGLDKSLEIYKEDIKNHIIMQDNLTLKLLRVFKRLDYHNSGINIISDAYNYDTCMHLLIEKGYINNKLLDETFNFSILKANKTTQI